MVQDPPRRAVGALTVFEGSFSKINAMAGPSSLVWLTAILLVRALRSGENCSSRRHFLLI